MSGQTRGPQAAAASPARAQACSSFETPAAQLRVGSSLSWGMPPFCPCRFEKEAGVWGPTLADPWAPTI